VQGLLTRTYALSAPLDEIERYVIGDVGLARLYDAKPRENVASGGGEGARLLLREEGGELRASVYFPDALIAHLESRPPQRGLDAGNVDAFAVFVEEIDHLLLAAERADAGRGVSLLELELHANVSKYLVLARFLAGRAPRLGGARRVWLRHHLFEKPEYADPDPEIRERYVTAGRHAARFLATLEALDRPAKVDRLRRFHRQDLRGKLALGAGAS
jgi:hypothetical protein